MRSISRGGRVRRAAAVGVLFLAVGGARAGFENGISMKIWNASWKLGATSQTTSGHLGRGLMHLMQYDVSHTALVVPVAVSLQYGFGDAWDYGTGRSDLLLAASYTARYVVAGLGYHRIVMRQDDFDSDWAYGGPELLLGVTVPLPGRHVAFLKGTYAPRLAWDGSFSDPSSGAEADANGVTAGHSLDVGVSHTFDILRVTAHGAIGYRLQRVAGDTDEGAGWRIRDDDFSGLYLSAGARW